MVLQYHCYRCQFLIPVIALCTETEIVVKQSAYFTEVLVALVGKSSWLLELPAFKVTKQKTVSISWRSGRKSRRLDTHFATHFIGCELSNKTGLAEISC